MSGKNFMRAVGVIEMLVGVGILSHPTCHSKRFENKNDNIRVLVNDLKPSGRDDCRKILITLTAPNERYCPT